MTAEWLKERLKENTAQKVVSSLLNLIIKDIYLFDTGQALLVAEWRGGY